MKRFLLIFIGFSLIVGCRSSSPSMQSILRISFVSYPTTFDSRKSGDFVSSTLICLLFEGLTRCQSGAEIELALAEKVEISPDQKTYLFFLRKSQWSDGFPVTAYDFEKTWKAILNPQFPALCSYLLYPIKNGELFAQGIVSEDQVGIYALDAQTLKVELEHPTPYFLSLTASPTYMPLPSHSDDLRDPNSAFHCICNGPFRIDSMIPNTEILLRKNPFFWNPSQIHLDKIHISIIPDETTALQMFERDELDLIGGPLAPLPLDSLQNLKKSSNLHFLPMAASTFCTFNTETFPFQNPSLRKAFACAIERNQIAQEIIQYGQIPATECVPPSLFSSKSSASIRKQNQEIARQLLQQAFTELNIQPNDLQLTLTFKIGQINKRLASALQKQWKDILGIEVRLEEMDPKTYFNLLHTRNYKVALSSWIAQFHDPASILERFKEKKNSKNYPGWENRQFSQLLEEANQTANPALRENILKKAESLIAQEMPIILLYHWSSPILLHSRVQNFTTTCNGGVLFEKCSVH